jgi:hypothetical protein
MSVDLIRFMPGFVFYLRVKAAVMVGVGAVFFILFLPKFG